jgi:hypothetical protein
MCSPKNVVDDFKNAARQLLSEGKHMGPETESCEGQGLCDKKLEQECLLHKTANKFSFVYF